MVCNVLQMHSPRHGRNRSVSDERSQENSLKKDSPQHDVRSHYRTKQLKPASRSSGKSGENYRSPGASHESSDSETRSCERRLSHRSSRKPRDAKEKHATSAVDYDSLETRERSPPRSGEVRRGAPSISPTRDLREELTREKKNNLREEEGGSVRHHRRSPRRRRHRTGSSSDAEKHHFPSSKSRQRSHRSTSHDHRDSAILHNAERLRGEGRSTRESRRDSGTLPGSPSESRHHHHHHRSSRRHHGRRHSSPSRSRSSSRDRTRDRCRQSTDRKGRGREQHESIETRSHNVRSRYPSTEDDRSPGLVEDDVSSPRHSPRRHRRHHHTKRRSASRSVRRRSRSRSQHTASPHRRVSGERLKHRKLSPEQKDENSHAEIRSGESNVPSTTATAAPYNGDRVERKKKHKGPETRERSTSPPLQFSEKKVEKEGKSESTSEPPPPKRSKWDNPIADDVDAHGNGVETSDDSKNRRLLVSNLPLGVSDAAVTQFFNGALLAAARVHSNLLTPSAQFPVMRAELLQGDSRCCFLEFRTASDADLCIKLDGISFNGFLLKIGRPLDNQMGFKSPNGATPESLSTATSRLGKSASETKVYVTELPTTVSDEELRLMCEPFGKVRSVALMKDLKTGQSMGCGVIEFEDVAATEEAVKALDRKAVGNKVPRFTKGSLLSSASRFMDGSDRTPKTSSIVTELPASMTYKIFGNAIIGAQVKTARLEGAKPTQVVQLLNAVFPEDLIKEEDYNTILDDMRQEASQYGELIDVVIPRPPEDLSYKPGVGKVFLHFSDTTAARRAQAELNGRRYDQRRVICAAFFPPERFLNKQYTLI